MSPQLARTALAAPISLNDAEGVHLLLAAGADPNRYADAATAASNLRSPAHPEPATPTVLPLSEPHAGTC